VLEDLSRHVLAFAGAGASPATLLDGWAERSHRRSGERAVGGWLVVPVGVGSEQWGRLVLASAHVEQGRARMVLERAAQSLLLQRMVEQDRDALLVQALGGLLDDLLTGRVVDDAEASARAGALGLSVSARYAPLVIKVAPPGQDALAQGAVDRQVLSSARQAVAGAGLTAIGSVRRGGTVALLIGCPYQSAVESSLAAVITGLGQRLGGRGLDGWVAGTAAAAAGLVEAAAGLVEAEHVAEVGLGMPGGRRLLRSADVRLRGLLALLRSDHRVQEFARTELGRLIEHDARTGDDLIAILRAYLSAGGGKSDTARGVGLSRPTLYARLATIERILGVSLDTAESRASLLAALMIMDANG
jgi:purine catabolism regulator